ncbi:MAG: photosystem stability/assembly factor-like protein, partial [Flavipsychrobacter sp.]|nr:photosystem stability/assembly factor-like protein [Flavipsychrobacter sp.]
MKVKYFFLLVFLWPFFCNAQYMWQALPSAPASYRFDDFHFINPDTGWAINPYYVHSRPNQFGRVFRTIDGGANWTQLVDSSITYYRSIGFADGQNGWIGNLADTVPYAGVPSTTDTIPLYQTNDGGTSWTPVNLPHPHPAGICGISVVTDSVVYAYGRYFGPAGFVKTIDKGNSWVFYDLDTIALGLIDGHFFNKDTGFITGMSPDHKAIILGTVNGGTSWTFAYYSSRADSDRVWKIYFPSRNIGYAS